MNAKKLLLITIPVIALALYFYFDLDQLLTLEQLKTHQHWLLDYAAQHQLVLIIGFAAVYVGQTALSLPGAAILSLAAGALFGTVYGTILTNIAATIGATLAFLASRYLMRETIITRFGAPLETLNRELEQRGFHYLLFLRLIPLVPFFLINLAAGLTRLPVRTFILATMLGIIPGGFVYVQAGASLSTINRPGDILSPRVLGSLVLLAFFSLIPIVYNFWKQRGKSENLPKKS